ncbi:MAG: GIY-YIG nuclease family protein [Flavobacteriales bacterium]|nr:GIY-YIG nuclease family protein [Flavobacteriales bacterium]MCB9191117.1 GIY-YIG nuclease family protein [Flavobacteriales bacterium]MCB9203463.1 GIY-YIG nuclease family protein [Flavobacteriales bacterium]
MSKSGQDQLSLPLTQFAIVDIETTGTIHDGKITEIAIIIHDGEKEIDRFTTLLNPQRPIDRYVVKLTGITDQMVADAPLFSEYADKIFDMTKDRVFVAHNVSFDYGFLKKEFAQLKMDFQRETLDTIDICRRIIPGLPSYSLGKLCNTLGIEMDSHHRALDDTAATATLFERLFKKDPTTVFSRIKPDMPDVRIPPNLPASELDGLPTTTGIYYFYDGDDQILYVGKSVNIKKRVLSHFHPKEKKKWAELWKNVHSISYEETGSELVALLLESQEIKELQPPINHSQKRVAFRYGIFESKNEDGYLSLAIKRKDSQEEAPLLEIKNYHEGKRLLLRQAKKHELCQCLMGLHRLNGRCFHYQIKNCRGTAMGFEPPEEYNKRINQAKNALGMTIDNTLVIGQGRSSEEYSLVQIEDGRYIGYGFIAKDDANQPLEDVLAHVRKQNDNPDTRTIIRNYLSKNKHDKLIVYKKNPDQGRDF